jgi:predicted flavoprotein YhiN
MKNITCNTLIIGGGPAGMMAAVKASEKKSDVILVEKNDRLGVKLLITGKGRCNITNAETDTRTLVEHYGKNGKFLYSALNKFGTRDIINFFEKYGLNTKIERGNRVFPVSDKSSDVRDVFAKILKGRRVKLMLGNGVKKVVTEHGTQSTKHGTQNTEKQLETGESQENRISKVVLEDGTEIVAKKYILTTGGKAYPATGSTGEAFLWLRNLGHTITELSPALVPIKCEEKFIEHLEGLSLKNVEIAVFQRKWNDLNGKPSTPTSLPSTKLGVQNRPFGKKLSEFGEAVFTKNGMSGPIVQNMSAGIFELLKEGEVKLKIDLKSALDFPTLDKRVRKDFQEFNNKMFRNSLDSLLPKSLIPIIIKLSNIDPDKKVNLITKEERKVLLHLLKEFELTVTGVEKFSKAIITKGGVDLREVDPKTMQSKVVSNLYFAGEVLDLDGPTGGYNLQICWSTGFCAGSR